jgi:copper(I)-binding protein
MAVMTQAMFCSARRLSRSVLLTLLVGTLLGCGSQAPAGPRIRVEEPWSRPAVAMEGVSGHVGSGQESAGMAPSQGGTGAVFMKLVNEGRAAERLVGAETDVAAVVEIHESRMEGDVMTMVFLPDGLEIPAQGEVLLKPGGYHLMLIGLQRDLKQGDTLALVLEFEKSGRMTVEAQVRQP